MTNTPTINSPIAHGRVGEHRDGTIVLTIPGTDYRLNLELVGRLDVSPGKPVRGRISAQARRIDVVGKGGRYIDPLYGRPRQLQGRVIATDQQANTLTVFCGVPFVCMLMSGQQAADFVVGALVSFSVERGATFEPLHASA